MRGEKFKDDNGDWHYTNTQGVTKKLLYNRSFNQTKAP